MRKHNKWQNISLNQIPVKKLYIFTTFNFEPTSFSRNLLGAYCLTTRTHLSINQFTSKTTFNCSPNSDDIKTVTVYPTTLELTTPTKSANGSNDDYDPHQHRELKNPTT